MLKHLIPYKSTFSVFITTHYGLVDGEPLVSDGHWTVAEKFFEFLQLFYESTVVLFGVNYPLSPLMLHHILEIAGHLQSNDTDPLLIPVLAYETKVYEVLAENPTVVFLCIYYRS